MEGLREKLRNIALEVVEDVKGENVESVMAGISFDIKKLVKGKEIVMKFRFFLSEFEFELKDILENGNPKMAQYENELFVKQQVNTLNRLYTAKLKRAGLGNKRLIRRNL